MIRAEKLEDSGQKSSEAWKQAAIETASRDTFTWVTGKYDYVNPPALKRLLVAGAILKPFPQEVLQHAQGGRTLASFSWL